MVKWLEILDKTIQRPLRTMNPTYVGQTILPGKSEDKDTITNKLETPSLLASKHEQYYYKLSTL
jgi:hypothetical protein